MSRSCRLMNCSVIIRERGCNGVGSHFILKMADKSDVAEYFRDVFSEYSADAALEAVQSKHKVKVNSLHSALPLLDLHGLRRRDFHSSLLTVLSAALQKIVESGLDDRSKERLLESGFALVDREEVQPILMRILKSMSSIPDKYLSYLASRTEDERLHSACSVEVKRKLWEYDSRLYGEMVSPLLDQYIADKEEVLYGSMAGNRGAGPVKQHRGSLIPVPFFCITSKQRRDSPVVRQLAEMVGPSVSLYNTLLQFLRTLYLRTHVSHYCSLRADITMALHNNKMMSVLETDPCYRFAWCLDACIAMRTVDTKKLRELMAVLDAYGERNDEALGDVSMLLRDPYALHCITHSLVRRLQELAEKETLPRESAEVVSLLRLVDLGLKSWDILDQQEFEEDELDTSIVVKFMPELMTLMVDTALQQVTHRLKETAPTPRMPPDTFRSQLDKQAAMLIASAYALHLAEQKDFPSLAHLLPIIASVFSSEDVQLPDGFLHHIGCLLCESAEVLREDLGELILKDFYLACCCADEGLLYTCRFLWLVGDKVPRALLDEVLKEMGSRSQRSDLLQEQYQALINHFYHQT